MVVLLTLCVLGFLLAILFFVRIERLRANDEVPAPPLPVTARVLVPQSVQLSLEAIGTLRAQQQLVEDGSVSRELFEQHRSDHERAEAALQQAEARLLQRQIRAPFNGITGIRRVDLGQYLNAGDAVVSLTALGTLYVDFALPQQALSRLTRGAEVRLRSDAWPDRDFHAQVSALESQIDPETRNVQVQASLDNGEHLLRPGMYVNVSLMLPARDQALVVPMTAIQASASGESVLVVRGELPAKEGRVESVPVVSGQRIGDDVIIERGLQAGDVVITEGQVRLQVGSAVVVAGDA